MSGYYAANPHYRRSDVSVDDADHAEAAERHDAFLRKMVDDEYWHAVRGERADLQLETGVATDKFSPGMIAYAAAIKAAEAKFNAAIVTAHAVMPGRLAFLRSNDEEEAA